MRYYIRRDLNEYGPYTLADLQRYVAQGNITLTDLTRAEGMTDWVPVSQVIGNIPPPASPEMVYGGPSAGMAPAGVPGYGAPYSSTPAGALTGAVPPDFHWALVLLIGIFTCGIFFWVWFLIEAAFVRKIRPQSNALILGVIGLVLNFGGQFFRFFSFAFIHRAYNPFGISLGLASVVIVIVAAFSMKGELEEYYNSVEPVNLRLSGVMVFFFAVFYFQHHFSRIAKWKKTGVLEPQS